MAIEQLRNIGGVIYIDRGDGRLVPVAQGQLNDSGPATPPRANAPMSVSEPRSRSVGQRMTGLLGDIPNMLNGTGIPERLAVANEFFNPVAGVYDSMDASQQMLAPNRTGYERATSLAEMLTGLAGAGLAGADLARGGVSGAAAVADSLLAGTPATRSMADTADLTAREALAYARSVGEGDLAFLRGGGVPQSLGAAKLMGGGTADATKTGWTFRDVRKPDLSRDENKRLQAMFDRTAWQETELPIGRMIATQPTVNADFAETLTSRDRLPVVVQKGNELFVRDGHHRLVKAAEAGNTKAKVALLNLDPRTKTPLLDYTPPAPWTPEDDALLAELLGAGLLGSINR